jgi:hypothetical protein
MDARQNQPAFFLRNTGSGKTSGMNLNSAVEKGPVVASSW